MDMSNSNSNDRIDLILGKKEFRLDFTGLESEEQAKIFFGTLALIKHGLLHLPSITLKDFLNKEWSWGGYYEFPKTYRDTLQFQMPEFPSGIHQNTRISVTTFTGPSNLKTWELLTETGKLLTCDFKYIVPEYPESKSEAPHISAILEEVNEEQLTEKLKIKTECQSGWDIRCRVLLRLLHDAFQKDLEKRRIRTNQMNDYSKRLEEILERC